MHGAGPQDVPVSGIDAVGALQHGAEPVGQRLELQVRVVGEGRQELVAERVAAGIGIMPLQAGDAHNTLGGPARDASQAGAGRFPCPPG